MSKHRHSTHLSLFVGFLLMTASAAAGQTTAGAGQSIEPDGSVSVCELESTNMNAPDRAAQVVSGVRKMNFGAKEGVQAVTIVYGIDFLPAA